MASVAPGRVHLWEMPWYWYAHGRTNCPRLGLVPRKGPDPERSVFRSKQRALESAGWLWLKSREQYRDSSTGKRVKFRQAFWTLTVPEPMPEHKARLALSEFWDWARTVAGVNSYLWVAELTKRGRVHFHALVNEWMDANNVRAAWLRALRRHGVSDVWMDLPHNLADVKSVTSAGKARTYVVKYFGKDFGNRACQLAARYRDCVKGEEGYGRDMIPEIRARLVDTLAAPNKVRRRWGASIDLERKPLQVNGFDDPRGFKAIYDELVALPGTKFGERSERGQGCYYQLDAVSAETAPVLHALLCLS